LLLHAKFQVRAANIDPQYIHALSFSTRTAAPSMYTWAGVLVLDVGPEKGSK
jgi:hypothetical protein